MPMVIFYSLYELTGVDPKNQENWTLVSKVGFNSHHAAEINFYQDLKLAASTNRILEIRKVPRCNMPHRLEVNLNAIRA